MRFQEDVPVVLGVTGALGPAIGPAGKLRGVGYVGPVFLMGEVDGAVPVSTGGLEHAIEAAVGYAIPLGSSFHLQPYLGGKAVTTIQQTLGGLSYGAIAYWRPSHPFGVHLRLAGTSPLGATRSNPQGAFLGGASAGLWWHPGARWGLVLEGGWSQWPNTLNSPAGTTFASEGIPTVTLGLGYKF
jgi:hypothetical protein